MHKISHSKTFVSQEDAAAVAKQVASGRHATGQQTRNFETEISKLVNTSYAKATTSGTTALHLSLQALGVGQGNEVIIPSYVCQAVLNAVNYTGASPVLVDIDQDFADIGFNISAGTIKKHLNENTKAIIVPHMFGTPANLDEILELEVPIIEDCAMSLGASYKGQPTGSIGALGIFSFFATKVISTGHGGMVATSSSELKEKLDDLTTYDQRDDYDIANGRRNENFRLAISKGLH